MDAKELATKFGTRMCDENGDTHGEELYCVGIDDIDEIIKEVAQHERNRTWTQKDWTEYEHSIAAAEREACAKVCDAIDKSHWGCEVKASWCSDAIRARGQA